MRKRIILCLGLCFAISLVGCGSPFGGGEQVHIKDETTEMETTEQEPKKTTINDDEMTWHTLGNIKYQIPASCDEDEDDSTAAVSLRSYALSQETLNKDIIVVQQVDARMALETEEDRNAFADNFGESYESYSHDDIEDLDINGMNVFRFKMKGDSVARQIKSDVVVFSMDTEMYVIVHTVTEKRELEENNKVFEKVIHSVTEA